MDVWAVGVMCLELVLKRSLFAPQMEQLRREGLAATASEEAAAFYRWLAAAEVDAIRREATPTRVCNRNGKARARSIGPWLTEALHAGSRKQE